MEKDINLIFHNEGLRSYIELDLCSQCPRQDDKGCCGYYSPVFYPTDLAFLYLNNKELIKHIFSLSCLTVLDTSITINSSKEGLSYRCSFHTKESGCLLPQHLRESVCRIFVCPGVGWWEEPELSSWQKFFDNLNDYELDLNRQLSKQLSDQGLTLRKLELRAEFFAALIPLYQEAIKETPEFIKNQPRLQAITIKRPIFYKTDWIL